MKMNNERYLEIIDEAYENYCSKCNEDEWMKEIKLDLPFPNKSYGLYAQEEFINKSKTDLEFSERWGLKIEERELSLLERREIARNTVPLGKLAPPTNWSKVIADGNYHTTYDYFNIPTKLITITYKDEKIEVYDN